MGTFYAIMAVTIGLELLDTLEYPMHATYIVPAVTAADVIVGTPLYMSPESVSGRPLDGRSDLHALGAVGYFLLTGEPVFTGASVIEVSAAHLHTPPLAPSARGSLAVPETSRPSSSGASRRIRAIVTPTAPPCSRPPRRAPRPRPGDGTWRTSGGRCIDGRPWRTEGRAPERPGAWGRRRETGREARGVSRPPGTFSTLSTSSTSSTLRTYSPRQSFGSM